MVTSILDTTFIQDLIMGLIGEEFMRACNKFPRFQSEHEGYAIIKEELDELWDAIKNNKHTTNLERMKEAIQLGAMAMRYVHDMAEPKTLDILAGV